MAASRSLGEPESFKIVTYFQFETMLCRRASSPQELLSVMQTLQVITRKRKLRSRSVRLFLIVTPPAGVIEYSPFAETPCFLVTQILPFTAGIDSPVMSLKWTIYLFSF